MSNRFRELARELRRRASTGDIHLGTKEDGGEYSIPRQWFHDTHAHVVGPSQSGKTRLLEYTTQQLIDPGDACVLVIDPHDGGPPYGGLFSGAGCTMSFLRPICAGKLHLYREVEFPFAWTRALADLWRPMTPNRLARPWTDRRQAWGGIPGREGGADALRRTLFSGTRAHRDDLARRKSLSQPPCGRRRSGGSTGSRPVSKRYALNSRRVKQVESLGASPGDDLGAAPRACRPRTRTGRPAEVQQAVQF